jgi:hypothetical protein
VEPASSPERVLRVVPVGSDDEFRAFDAFLHAGSFILGSQGDVDLWCKYIPQLSHMEPAIRHGGIAIGSLLLQKRMSRSSQISRIASAESDSFTAYHYQKAIQSTLGSIRIGKADERLAGITCILFFSIEALQGNEQEALRLFERGNQARLMPNTQQRRDDLTIGLEQSFSRLSCQWSMFEGSVANVSDISEQQAGPIHSILQAQSEVTRYVTAHA